VSLSKSNGRNGFAGSLFQGSGASTRKRSSKRQPVGSRNWWSCPRLDDLPPNLITGDWTESPRATITNHTARMTLGRL